MHLWYQHLLIATSVRTTQLRHVVNDPHAPSPPSWEANLVSSTEQRVDARFLKLALLIWHTGVSWRNFGRVCSPFGRL